MKLYCCTILFFAFSAASYGQVIIGTVYDKQTNETIPYATVYFSGTLTGTSTDNNGFFELDISKYKTRPLTISAIGYNTYTMLEIPMEDTLIVNLEPTIYELGEAMVSTKSLTAKRKSNLRLFKREFLGTSYNAKRCEILNEEDITFDYSSSKDILKVIALKPLQIHNTSLGYEITYFLNNFEYDKKDRILSFSGNIIFNKDLAVDSDEWRTYQRLRKYAYDGSRMHLIRSLWNDNLESAGFMIRDSLYNDITVEQIVFPFDKQTKVIRSNTSLDISYKTTYSTMYFQKGAILFQKDGFVDPSGLIWGGSMAKKRVADLLPYEY